jgi:hypothetical protein
MRDRPAATDPLDQCFAAMNRQPGVSVHGGLLRVVCVFGDMHTYSRRPLLQVDPVNNVGGQYT